MLIEEIKNGENKEMVINGGYLDLGIIDTMEDLIVDTIGALVAGIFGWLYIKQENDTIFNKYFDKWFSKDRKRKAKLKKGEQDATNKENIETI